MLDTTAPKGFTALIHRRCSGTLFSGYITGVAMKRRRRASPTTVAMSRRKIVTVAQKTEMAAAQTTSTMSTSGSDTAWTDSPTPCTITITRRIAAATARSISPATTGASGMISRGNHTRPSSHESFCSDTVPIWSAAWTNIHTVRPVHATERYGSPPPSTSRKAEKMNPWAEAVFDTLSALVERFHGINLPKGDRLTDWLRRPLNADQCSYAVADVEYLLDLRSTLVADLESRGRLAWFEAECENLRQRGLISSNEMRSLDGSEKYSMLNAPPSVAAAPMVNAAAASVTPCA